MSATLYIAISYHGYGHIAQTAPVVHALLKQRPQTQLIIQSAAPLAILQEHFHAPFRHIQESVDIGMCMASSLSVAVDESYRTYQTWHADWPRQVDRMMKHLQHLKPNLVLANIPYLPLLAAQRLGVPAVGLCSLNWAEIFHPYCQALPRAERIYHEIHAAYQAATLFLTPLPSMAMPGLHNRRDIGPIARIGTNCRAEINRSLGLSPDDKLVLVFLGGIATPLTLAQWPKTVGVNFLVHGAPSTCERQGIYALETLDLSYLDVLCSVDALVTKPGYGSIAEVGCNAIPTLYVRRYWPEEPFLIEWLSRHGNAVELTAADLATGNLAPALKSLWSLPHRDRVAATGAEEGGTILAQLLNGAG